MRSRGAAGSLRRVELSSACHLWVNKAQFMALRRRWPVLVDELVRRGVLAVRGMGVLGLGHLRGRFRR